VFHFSCLYIKSYWVHSDYELYLMAAAALFFSVLILLTALLVSAVVTLR